MNEQENLPKETNSEIPETIENTESVDTQAITEEVVEAELGNPELSITQEIVEETPANESEEVPIEEVVAEEIIEIPAAEAVVEETAELELPEPAIIETPTVEAAAEEIPEIENPAASVIVEENPVVETPSAEAVVEETTIIEAPVAEMEVEKIAEVVAEEIPVAEPTEAKAETATTDIPLFETHEEEHSDDQAAEYVSEAEVASLKKHSKEELVAMAWEAAKMPELNEASQTFKKLRPIIEVLWNADFQAALQVFIENGGVREDFEYSDTTKEDYNSAYKEFANRREAYRKQLEQEKLKNLEAKRAILNQIKEIAEQEDSSGSLQQIKDLQNQWKAIRAIPNEAREELWNKYTYFLDKFYDNLGINNELKELDRRKTLK